MTERADIPAKSAWPDARVVSDAVRTDAPSPHAERHADHVPRGIGFMVLATILFSTASALTKWQVGLYPVGEVVFSRSISSLIVCAAVMLPMTGFSVGDYLPLDYCSQPWQYSSTLSLTGWPSWQNVRNQSRR